LTQFKEHPDAWQRVPKLLEESSQQYTKVGDSQLSHALYRLYLWTYSTLACRFWSL
jgi:hypothetical protein